MHIAAASGKLELVQYLVQNYPSLVHTVTVNQTTPLHTAVAMNQFAVTKFLLKETDLATQQSSQGLTIVHTTTILNHTNLNPFLALTNPFLFYLNNHKGQNPVHIAAQFGNLEAFRALINIGFYSSLTERDGNGYTALHTAAAANQPAITEALVRTNYNLLFELDNN